VVLWAPVTNKPPESEVPALMPPTKALKKQQTPGRLVAAEADHSQIQPLFDKVLASMRLQGYVRSTGAAEACTYRGDDGLRCFVGHLIPDRSYRPDMEGSTVNMLHESGQVFSTLTYESLEFLEHLQSIHDDEPPTRWEAALADLAEDYDLEYSPPKQGRKK